MPSVGVFFGQPQDPKQEESNSNAVFLMFESNRKEIFEKIQKTEKLHSQSCSLQHYFPQWAILRKQLQGPTGKNFPELKCDMPIQHNIIQTISIMFIKHLLSLEVVSLLSHLTKTQGVDICHQ